MAEAATLAWVEEGATREARWQSEAGVPPPTRVMVCDDRTTADAAFRAASEGTGLLWRGDFQNARQLLQAIARRIDRKPFRPPVEAAPAQAFHLYRQAQAQRARTLGRLLIPFEDDYRIPLRRAPDVAAACAEAYGPPRGPFVAALRELQGVIGAHEWRKRGVPVPALGASIHPWHGVFAPVRGEYVDLVARAPLPAGVDEAWDVGCGTGVLAAVLARRGVPRVVATDLSPVATGCARENLARLGLAERVEVVEADLFPPGRAGLVVCNPPWLPGKPGSPLERAIYDAGGAMLHGFLEGLGSRLAPGGEGWLVMSDLAERLGLREPDALPRAFEAAGLRVVGREDARPRHGRTRDASDPFHAARAAEITSLWRLGAA